MHLLEISKRKKEGRRQGGEIVGRKRLREEWRRERGKEEGRKRRRKGGGGNPTFEISGAE